MPIEVLEAFMHIGTKYVMPELRDLAMGRITSNCPTSLAGWQDRPALRESTRHINSFTSHRPNIQDLSNPTTIVKLLNIAHRHDIASALPSLYLACAHMSYESSCPKTARALCYRRIFNGALPLARNASATSTMLHSCNGRPPWLAQLHVQRAAPKRSATG